MFGDIIQPTHLLFVLIVALVFLGPKRLPEVGRSLGRGLRDFRQGMQGVEAEARSVFKDTIDEPEAPATTATRPTLPAFSPAVPASPAPHFVISADSESTPVAEPPAFSD
jgi:sec-independent protein translocase protein TatA